MANSIHAYFQKVDFVVTPVRTNAKADLRRSDVLEQLQSSVPVCNRDGGKTSAQGELLAHYLKYEMTIILFEVLFHMQPFLSLLADEVCALEC